jgi:hypothetical protein
VNISIVNTNLIVETTLVTKEQEWLNLLDRLGGRDIQEFTRLIQGKRAQGLQGHSLTKKVYRSAAKNTGLDPSEVDAVYQHRRDWLQFWIYYLADGSRTTIELMLGYGKSYVAQCLDKDYQGGRAIGDRAARLMEMRLGRPAKSMDEPFFPFWDTPQNALVSEPNEEQRGWLSLLDGLNADQVREMTIMVHARRQHNLELMQRYGFFTAPSRPILREAPIFRKKFENRRAWLRHWIDIYAGGKNRAFAEKIGVSWTIPSQYLSTTYANGRGLSDKAARRIEIALGLKEGAMDQPFQEN